MLPTRSVQTARTRILFISPNRAHAALMLPSYDPPKRKAYMSIAAYSAIPLSFTGIHAFCRDLFYTSLSVAVLSYIYDM